MSKASPAEIEPQVNGVEAPELDPFTGQEGDDAQAGATQFKSGAESDPSGDDQEHVESEVDAEFIELTIDGESLPMEEEEEDEVEDDELEASDDPLIKKIRAVNRKKNDQLKTQKKELDDLKRVVAELKSGAGQESTPKQTTAETLPPRPRYEDYDTDEEFEAAQDDWFGQKTEFDRKQAEENRLLEEQNKIWGERIDLYKKGQKRFKGDFEAIERKAMEHMSQEQLGIVVRAAKDPSLLVSAFARDPEAKNLTKIKDPVLFAVALGEYQKSGRVGTKKRTPKTSPERTPRGGASSGLSDSNLASLEAKALKTGNRSELIRYKRKKGLI